MALTFTENFRSGVGGRAFRMIEVTHVGLATSSITAASMDLTYIEAIVGTSLNYPVSATSLSELCAIHGISISADHTSLVWSASTAACTQHITIVGWLYGQSITWKSNYNRRYHRWFVDRH